MECSLNNAVNSTQDCLKYYHQQYALSCNIGALSKSMPSRGATSLAHPAMASLPVTPRQERQKQPEAIRSNEKQPRAARTSQGQPEDSRGWPGARQQRWAAWKRLGTTGGVRQLMRAAGNTRERLGAAGGGQERPGGSGKRLEAACGARERAV